MRQLPGIPEHFSLWNADVAQSETRPFHTTLHKLNTRLSGTRTPVLAFSLLCFLSLFCLLALLQPLPVSAGELNLSWDPNAESDLQGYNVYQSTTSGTYSSPPDTIQGNITMYTATNLTPGQPYFFVVTAFDTSGNESTFSNEASGAPFPALAVTKAGSGAGSVSSSPSGINCGPDCSQGFVSGTSVTLTASASAGSAFTGWTGSGCSGVGSCTVVVTADTNVTATFDALPVTLTAGKTGSGSGTLTSSPGGIDCGQDCTEVYSSGTSVTLTATASAGSVLTGWTGGGCSGIGSCTVVMTTDTTVTATFGLGTPTNITNLTVASGRPYEIVDSGLQAGALVYIDRAFTYSAVPSFLVGSTYIKTANDDKTGTASPFLTFEVDQPTTVYVAYDTQFSTPPAWLAAFTDTGLSLDAEGILLRLFEKDFAPGLVALGANEGGGSSSMYTVVIPAQGSSPVILSGIGTYLSSGGWIEAMEPGAPHGNIAWPRVQWDPYNISDGQTRPITCDLDGDGKDEVVIGLGPLPGDGGWVQVKDDQDTNFAPLGWLRVAWSVYNNTNGETFPSCGDLDGDGRDEIVIGLGAGGDGWLQAFDDATANFQVLGGTPFSNGWFRLDWDLYNDTSGEVHPAIGNLDDDPAEELVLGLGTGGEGRLMIIDDAATGFAPLPGTPASDGWVQVQWPTYNTNNGETRPTVCDLDGDGKGELTVGFGSGGNGWVQILNPSTTFGPLAGTPTAGGWVGVDWNAYRNSGKGTYPACGDLDADGRDELVLGLESYPSNGGWMEIKEDLAGNLAHKSWARLHWSMYNSTHGETRPAVAR